MAKSMETIHAENLKKELIREIGLAKSDLLDLFPVDGYIDLLDSSKSYGNYRTLPPQAVSHGNELSKYLSADLMETYQKLVMLTLISQFERRCACRKIPESIIELFNVEFIRIVDEMSLPRTGYYQPTRDQFLKDLGICRLKLYPCGPVLLDEFSGIPRRIFFRRNLRQLLELALFFLTRCRGFRPCYELHMHAPLRKNFHTDGWIACNIKIAELLSMNPDIKGVVCSSWWYDPQLETISPRLTYLSTLPSRNGAMLFHLEPDKTAAMGATEKSETRRRLFDAGEYIPQIYMMVWPRRELIKWASKQLVITPQGQAPARYLD